jgi:hypothetical protein
MSEKPKDALVFSIWRTEKRLGRPLSHEERATIEKVHKEMVQLLHEEAQRHPVMRARAAVAFMKKHAAFLGKLKARQATTTPDFDALYKKKADIDQKLSE